MKKTKLFFKRDISKEFVSINFNIFYQDIYLFSAVYRLAVYTYEIKCFSFICYSFSIYIFIYLFIYLYIYLFRAAKFMHTINIIHRSFSPTALFPCLSGCLSFSLPCLFPYPAYFLCFLPVSLPCLLLCPAYFLALPISMPCLFPCPAYFRALPNFLDLLIYSFFMSAWLHGYIASNTLISLCFILL